jgi:hypothetical protein
MLRFAILGFPSASSRHMIIPQYRVADSRIAGAGKGLFLSETVPAGSIIVAPEAIPRVYSMAELMALPDAEALLPATVRWFEESYTATPEWPDECYINHSFNPSALWHLGFVFASSDLAADTEVTVDYRHLLGEGQQETFADSDSGAPIIGLPWRESLLMTSTQLSAVLARR